jgi:hypothetical protein
MALARISQPSDLVITAANWTGDPVAIYYSRRHGWVFPPAWPGVNWSEDIVDESAAIQLFDRLRSNGAKWFGIVAEQRTKFHDTLPRLLAHIQSTTELVDYDHDWSIYRILKEPGIGRIDIVVKAAHLHDPGLCRGRRRLAAERPDQGQHAP